MNLPTVEIPASYNYQEVIAWLRGSGREYLRKNFKIPENERGIIFGMLAWFLQDELVAEQMKIDLGKGIMLSGPIGCGKTTLFRLMKQLPSRRAKFAMVTTRQVVSQFMHSGFEVLEYYSRGNLYNEQRITKNYCFDDLGTEATSKYYGNDCNVMAEFYLTVTNSLKKMALLRTLRRT